ITLSTASPMRGCRTTTSLKYWSFSLVVSSRTCSRVRLASCELIVSIFFFLVIIVHAFFVNVAARPLRYTWWIHRPSCLIRWIQVWINGRQLQVVIDQACFSLFIFEPAVKSTLIEYTRPFGDTLWSQVSFLDARPLAHFFVIALEFA